MENLQGNQCVLAMAGSIASYIVLFMACTLIILDGFACMHEWSASLTCSWLTSLGPFIILVAIAACTMGKRLIFVY